MLASEAWGNRSARLWTGAVLIFGLGCGIPYDGAALGQTMFDSRGYEIRDRRAYPRFYQMVERYSLELDKARSICPSDNELCIAINSWASQLQELAALPPLEQIEAVNDYLNGFDYVEDEVNWQKFDYWETPLQFHQLGGDCEDYAVAKYYSLRGLGFEPSSLRILVVQDEQLGVVHALLAVTLDGTVYFLDNQIEEVVTADQAPHYRPLMSINEQSVWQHY